MISVYCVDDITIIKYGGVDTYNHPQATSEVDVKGKIEYKTRFLSDPKGQEVVAGSAGRAMSSAMVRFPESIEVDLGRALQHEDRLKFNDIEHTILMIEKPKAFSNPHYEVYVA